LALFSLALGNYSCFRSHFVNINVVVVDRLGRKVAIKECLASRQDVDNPYNYANISNKELEDFKQEALHLKQLRPHHNIVPFCKQIIILCFCLLTTVFSLLVDGICLKPQFSIICEFCEGGSLDALLYESTDALPLQRCWRWIRGIAAGTQHLHKQVC
jgi:serine/threonine protein kinase